MPKLFISHSSQDDALVRALRTALADFGPDGWIDSRELRGGDLLWPEIAAAIEAASGYLVLVSVDSLQSTWVGKELRHALTVQQARGKDRFPVLPLLLDGTGLGVLEGYFAAEPLTIAVSSKAGGIEAAIDSLLVALHLRQPADVASTPQPQPSALEELVLKLSDFTWIEQNGVQRASARAQLVYEPATPGQPPVHSAQSWRLVAPTGPLEADELAWYLEKYAIWPSRYFLERAKQVEANLLRWGQSLYAAALPALHRENVLQAWEGAGSQAERRFSVYVDTTPEAGTPEPEVNRAKEVATVLLSLPWELLHDGSGYLFQGAKPIRVRRRLPGTLSLPVPVVALPIRILLVTARPEDEACSYIDHRISALPLVDAMENLPGQVELHLLNPPTLPALRAELVRADAAQQPYHVVHFDGHGVYDQRIGLGGLCFEKPEDAHKLTRRGHAIVYTAELGPLLRQHRIPLVFLEACQSAQAAKAAESVASELLKVGVASVVAMSHSVLVATASRFVDSFYGALVKGKRVGEAMLAGQHRLKDDSLRGYVFGEGEFRLQDWFVPVLFQEKDDPVLFRSLPNPQTVADFHSALKNRLGALPDAPETGFIGRSRELLMLERLLRQGQGQGLRYAVLQGQGGEGKTALATEFARWMVRAQQVRRIAFVSLEGHSHPLAVLDAMGCQLVGKNYSAAAFDDVEQATLELERALREQATLLVLDNMESILPPPYSALPAALQEEAQHGLADILNLCQRLGSIGTTWLLFTSREALPKPFAGHRQHIVLHHLARQDAVALVESVLGDVAGVAGAAGADGADGGGVVGVDHAGKGAGAARDAQLEEIEQLVDAVHGHARTLALLAPALRTRGVAATRSALATLMLEMDQAFPGEREKSLFASVALSLARLSGVNQERVQVLGVFHGGFQISVLANMMQWQEADAASLAQELVQTGLATQGRYRHLTLNPALCPYLGGRMGAAAHAALLPRWVAAMCGYVGFLYQQRNQNAEVAATLTLLELANLFVLLEQVHGAGDAAGTIDLATDLYRLLQALGKPRLLVRVGQVRDAAAAALGDSWNHARFDAARTRIDQQLGEGQLHAALEGAQALHQRAQQAGEAAYAGADYDLAMACFLLARVLTMGGAAEPALPLLQQAGQRFEAIAQAHADQAAQRMAGACITEQGDCLRALGRLDAAAAAYEEGIRRDEQRGDQRGIAVGKGQLGTVRYLQRRYPAALVAHAEARERFSALDEPGSVAISWHQTGMAYQDAGQPQAAEDAYRQALAIWVRLGNSTGQAGTLLQLGNLYGNALKCPEPAARFYRQAADKFAAGHDLAKEGIARSNLANTLRQLQRLDEARSQIQRAIECKAPFGHAGQAWRTWDILADIETDSANPVAAAVAKGKAVASFLAYRHAGGESHSDVGRLSLAISQHLLAGDPARATALLAQQAADWEAAGFPSFVPALQAIAGGSRARSLAEAPDLHYTMVAEILFLLGTLENPPPRSA